MKQNIIIQKAVLYPTLVLGIGKNMGAREYVY